MEPLLLALVVSGCLGALIGLIRQWSEQAALPAGEGEFSGVRTFTLWAVLGCVAAFLHERYSPALLPVVLAAAAVHLVLRPARAGAAPAGSTTFVASLVTLLLGALVYWRHFQPAILTAAIAMVLLGFKQPIHAWTRAFTPVDIRLSLQFVAITGVILPLVPDRAFGPFAAFNPYSTWLMVVLISGLGFAGYLAMRLLGSRAGLLLTSLLGGLASSTATTLAFSRRSREDPALSTHYALAVAAACAVMLPRVLVAISVLSRDLALALVAPFAAMALPAVGYGAWLWSRRQPGATTTEAPALTNPLSLTTAVKFALLYAVISVLVKAAAQLDLLQSGLLPLSFVSGLTDMDAIALSVARHHGTATVPLGLATQAVVIAVVGNSLLKAALAVSLGSPVLRRHVAVVLGLTAVAGVAALPLLV